MTIVVETGQALSNAVSYVSVEEADAYHLARVATLWTEMTTAEKEGCLVRATDFMLQKYRMRWAGRRYNGTQALDWPRVGVVMEEFEGVYGQFIVSYEVVPKEVKNACAELALRASISTLSEDLSPRVLQETIGPITIKYDKDSGRTMSYMQVEDMLKPFFAARSGSPMMKLSRC
jgi:hypothetical protein